MNPPTYELRPAQPENLNFIRMLHRMTMRNSVEPIWGWDEAEQAALLEQRYDPRVTSIVIVDKQQIGSVSIVNGDGYVFLNSIMLMPQHQRQGLGTCIIGSIIERARARSRSVRLTVLRTNPARVLYERLGFRIHDQDANRYHLEYTISRPPDGC
jgi:ribosomal protein S18 acetylase RimI-like enzyme